jgi:hypothetical protein
MADATVTVIDGKAVIAPFGADALTPIVASASAFADDAAASASDAATSASLIRTSPARPKTGILGGISARGRHVLEVLRSGRIRQKLSDDSDVPMSALAEPKRVLPSGATFQTVSLKLGWFFGLRDRVGKIIFGLRTNGKLRAHLDDESTIPPAIIQTAIDGLAYFPSEDIAMLGDSLTTMMDQTLLASLTGKNVVDLGIGGQTPLEIVARFGALPMTCTVTSNQIPASGGVALTAYSQDILYSSGTSGVLTIPGTLAGVRGTMTGSGGSSTRRSAAYTFTRSTAGSAVSCPAGTAFIPDNLATYRNHTIIACFGRNGDSGIGTLDASIDIDEVIPAALALLNCQQLRDRRIMMRSVPTSYSETAGSAGYIRVTAVNTWLAFMFGDRFLDERRFLIDNAAKVAATIGVTLTGTDLTQIAADTIPQSFFRDPIHPTDPVYDYELEFIQYPRLLALGWA